MILLRILPWGPPAALAVVATLIFPSALHAARGGQLSVKVVDAKTQEQLAARMHLKNARGRPVKVRGENLYGYGDHLIIDGQADLELGLGQYTFTLDAGPEYKPRSGHFEIQDHADDEETIEMHRFVDLAEEGWWAGDLFAMRLHRHADVLMRCEGLAVLPLVVDAESRRNPRPNVAAIAPTEVTQGCIAALQSIYVQDARGAVVVHNAPDSEGRLPAGKLRSTSDAVAYAQQHGCHLDVACAASWDLPLWITADAVDTIQLIDSSAGLDNVRKLPVGCRPRDRSFFPGKTGQGRWTERIYFHLLNCGLRIAPAAGSGSGATPNPPGLNRVYVHLDSGLDYRDWWTNLRAGRVSVTNGPLLRPHVQGRPPGYVFHLDEGASTELEIGLNLATRDRIEYLEIVKNGEVVDQVQLEKWAQAGGRLPPLPFDDGGWFLVRAATINPNVYQFASSGPYYVESGYGPRVSRASVQFFLDWIDELEQRDRRDGRLNPDRTEQLQAARTFWNGLGERANAP